MWRELNGDLEQEARLGLLHYFSDKCTAHGTNLLTIAIGLFVYAQAHTYLMRPFPLIYQLVLNASILPLILALGIHQFARLWLWGHYTTLIVNVKLDPSKKLGGNLVYWLHNACYEEMKDTLTYKIAAKYVVMLFFIVFALSFVIIFLFGYLLAFHG